ncbi:MAG: addiction module protein [Gammaproteobacteria bacterium RIFCSPHIGHO2_12_FULL_40_19]|nr:MAG: addiction module protein [Gammaproteobacteria bacterium RIFCSPHIGHO2_12_FULL_40_19]
MNPNQPYNDLPLLPPKVELETPAVLKKAITANRMLAELKGSVKSIPNQGILVNGIVLQEARLSSEIENIVTTNDELYRAAADENLASNPHAKEVLRYRQALWHGFSSIKKRPLSTNLFTEIVEIIKNRNIGIRKVPGTKIANPITKDVIYTPPEGESIIRDKLSNLEKYLHADDSIDPLIKLAILHYQFEAIHPFVDGNGRTGRIINILFLIEKGLLDSPILFLSHYILRTKSAYYSGLRSVTEKNAWADWVMYILDAIEITASETERRVSGILAAMDDAKTLVKTKAPKIYSKDLIETIFEHPYCKIRFLEEAGIAKRQTAANYLQTLVEIGLLHVIKKGREQYYINQALVNVLSK